MGQIQSQTIENYINNNINTTAIANVISSYATTTNAITTNTQDLCVNIVATGDINFGPQGFVASQEIDSIIDVQSLIDRADKEQLINDLQRVVSTELKDAIERTTGGFDLLERSINQELRNSIVENIDNYVNQTINMQTIDQVLLSSSNVQRGCYNFSAANVVGPLVITQRIQSNIMANNIVRQVVDRIIQNTDVVEVTTDVQGQITSVNTAQIPNIGGAIGTWLLYAGGAIVIVLSLVLAYFLPVGIRAKVIIGIVGILLGIALIIVGIIRSRTSTTVVAPIN